VVVFQPPDRKPRYQPDGQYCGIIPKYRGFLIEESTKKQNN
jgi:hypothetical protein